MCYGGTGYVRLNAVLYRNFGSERCAVLYKASGSERCVVLYKNSGSERWGSLSLYNRLLFFSIAADSIDKESNSNFAGPDVRLQIQLDGYTKPTISHVRLQKAQTSRSSTQPLYMYHA